MESNIPVPILERDKKISGLFKSGFIFYIVLIALVILGVYIRSLPLAVNPNTGHPGLWDITTNDYTLGPDLDPFLFLRYAKDIAANGTVPEIDSMRYYPIGFDTAGETKLLPWMIFGTYKLLDVISPGTYSINYAGALLPVIMFALTILAFFFFVKEIFYTKEKNNKFSAMLIASISTLFLIVIPAFLARTIAGIPEKESAGFFFMFLAFYLFIKSWKQDSLWKSSIYGILAGVATAGMGLIWGGVTYVYTTIAIAGMIAFILNKFKTNDYIAYAVWYLSSVIVLVSLSAKFSIKGFLLSLDSGLAFLVLAILIFHFIVTKLKFYDWLKQKYPKITLPNNLLSIIGAIIFLLIAASVLIKPTFVWDKIMDLNRIFFNPMAEGRWSTTVAENQQPYFVQWAANFGTYFLWTFLIGSMIFVKELFKKLSNKDNYLIVGSYIFFLIGLMYSRYAPHPMLFDGENFISKAFYLISAATFLVAIVYNYIKYHKDQKVFDNIDFGSILMLVLFILTLFTARSAVRLVMVLATVAPIFAAYLIAQLIAYFQSHTDATKKVFIGLAIAVVIIGSSYSAFTYYNITQNQAKSYVPYYYTYQWQEAMSWVRDHTPTNAVFAHWWDYGYWVQSIGNRATVTDGGNSFVYWNYLTGRYVLTGDNQKESLDFLYTHNVTNLLIDSSDIGKYGAFSQIGSDAELDRLSVGPLILVSDQRNLQETRNGEIRIYQGGNYLDEDIYYNGTYILKENGAVLGIKLEKQNGTYLQPQGIFYNNGMQVILPLRYLYTGTQIQDWGYGINATAYPIQRIFQGTQGYQIDQQGALIYVSPRVLRGFLGQVYILNDPFNNFPAFKIEHIQQDYIMEQFGLQGAQLNEFVEYGGIKGSIKIWNITYPEGQQSNPKYLNTSFPPEITWRF